MTILTLSALPGHHERTPGKSCSVTIGEILGERLGNERAEIRNLADIRVAVQSSGTQFAATHPDRSSIVSITVAKGCRKPDGFDAANRGNGLGQQQWMRTVTKEREPATPTYGVRALRSTLAGASAPALAPAPITSESPHHDPSRNPSPAARLRTPPAPVLHIFSFRFAPEDGFRRSATILVRGRMDQIAAIGNAYAEAAKRGREPWCVDIRTVPAPRATPVLDAICRRHTGFASFLDLLTAPAGYRPSLRLDLIGREGAMPARAYDQVQARWGDQRRAFVSGKIAPRPAAARTG